MFESWVSDLLASSLGHFIDVQRDKLKVSLWNGVVISNASIREGAFDYLDLPFTVSHGSIGRLQIQVPWRSWAIGSSPIVVELSDVRLLGTPREEKEWCEASAMKRAIAAKQAELAAAELAALSSKVAADGHCEGMNFKWAFMSHLWGAILRRLELRVKSVEVSFEYKTQASPAGFTFGVRIGSIEMSKEHAVYQCMKEKEESMDDNIEKSLTLSGLSAYWHIHDDLSDDDASEDFIVSPLDCCFSIWFRTNHQYTQQTTQFRVKGHVQEVTVQASNLQLAQLVHFTDLLKIWTKRKEYGKFRPDGWVDSRQKSAGSCHTSWRCVWQYAIKSVLQDLHNLQPGFSLARVQLWQQWRRRYVALYKRHVESSKQDGIEVCASSAEELRRLEAELPVSVVMLFRSIAERGFWANGDSSEDLANQGLTQNTWFGWGMSGIWGFLGYSSASSSTHQIPELPSQAQLSELCRALDFEPSSQVGRKEPQRILQFELELKTMKATLWQQLLISEKGEQILTVELVKSRICADLKETGCNCIMSCGDLRILDKCSKPGFDQLILERRQFAQSSELGNEALLRVSFTPEVANTSDSTDPHLKFWVSPLNLTLQSNFLKRLSTIAACLPSSTLSTWIARSITCLTSRRARTLAKAHHLAFSQSKVKIEVEIRRVNVQIPAQSAGVEAGNMVLDFETIHLVSNPAKDMWDYVRLLRQIEHEHPLDTESGRFVFEGGSDSGLFDDLERKFLYRQWDVTIHSLLVCTQAKMTSIDQSDTVLDKVSGTGSLFVNRMTAEDSAAAFLCDWRLSPVKLRAFGSQVGIICSMLRPAKESSSTSATGLSSVDQARKVYTLTEEMNYTRICCVVDEGLHVDSVMPSAHQSHSDCEVSISTPEVEIHIEDQEDGNTYCIGGNLPCSYSASSKSLHVSFISRGGNTSCGINVAKLTVQDTGNYGGKQISARGPFPRLAKNLYVEEVVIHVKSTIEGNLGVRIELNGAEGTAYPGEIAGYLKPSMPLVRATGEFSWEKCAAQNSSKVDISLGNACFGSTFIMRIIQFGILDSNTNLSADIPVKPEMVCHNPELNTFSYMLAGAEWGKSVALSFKIKNCHAVLPKGAQHMAAVLGMPGGHCGMLLRVPDFQLHAAYLRGFVGDTLQWSFFELGKLYATDLAVLASRGSHNCLMTPAFVIDKVSLTSSGACFSGDKFPLVWNKEPRSIRYEMEVTNPSLSLDMPRLEVIACSLGDALVKFYQLTGAHGDEPSPEKCFVKQSKALGQKFSKYSVPFLKISLTLSVPTINFSFVRHSAEQSDLASGSFSTYLECSGVKLLYFAIYGLGEESTAQSPFQLSLKDEYGACSSFGAPNHIPDVLHHDKYNPSSRRNGFHQDIRVSWRNVGLYEKMISQDQEAFFYFLTPDGRVLEYSRPDERELIAREISDSSLALSLWAPVKVDGGDDNLSSSLSSAGSFETAGSNFSTAQKASIMSTSEFYSIGEEEPVGCSPRSISGHSEAFGVEDFFSDAGDQTNEKIKHNTASTTSKDVPKAVVLLKMSASECCNGCAILITESIEPNKNKEISIMCPHTEVYVNLCPWVSTLEAALEAARIVKQYKSSSDRKDKEGDKEGLGLKSLIRISVPSLRVMVACIGPKAGVACQNNISYPGLILHVESLVGTCHEAVQLSISTVSFSSCWTESSDSSIIPWEANGEPRQLLLANKLDLEGSLSSLDHSSMADVAFKLSIEVVKMWFSYYRSIPLLLVMTWAKEARLRIMADRSEASNNQRDSTSAPSSLLNIIQQYGAGSDGHMAFLNLFGKLSCQFGSISLLLSDDRSQTDFPLLDASIEPVRIEAKREMDSSLFVWGMELSLTINIYNRRKMGWEALVEPWLLKVSAESRLCRNTIHQSSQHDLGLHTLLRCISDQPVQLTLSDGMLETVGIIQELIVAASKLSPERIPVAPALADPQGHESKYFTTHWLYNQTGVAMHFWTTRETTGSSVSSNEPSLYASPELSGNVGIPLRAVAVTEKGDTNGIGTRQMSLSEISLCKEAQGDAENSPGTLVPSEQSHEIISSSFASLDASLRNGKLPSVGEDEIQEMLPKQIQKWPVEHNVVSHGFDSEIDPILGCENFSFSRHRHMCLYFRLDNQEIACGPVTLDTAGTKVHTVRISDSPLNTRDSERDWMKAEVVCNVRQRSTGGFDVSVHSNAKITNNTSTKLQIECSMYARQPDPLVLIVNPEDSAWLPITAATYGNVRLRPHPISSDPWAMRSAWSAPVHLPQLYHELSIAQSVFCHIKCDPVSGGLKPVWLNIGAVKNSDDLFVDIQVQSPVLIHNYLPVPTDVELKCQGGLILGLRGTINPRCSIQGHTLEGSRVDHIAVTPKGYKMAQVGHFPQSEATIHSASQRHLGILRPSGEDMRLADSIVKIECEGAGAITICISHSVEGFTGRHIFEICCALWVYNCTGLPVAVREHQDHEPFDDEEAVRIPDDKVPNRWVPPFMDTNLREEHGAPNRQESTNIRRPTPTSAPVPPLGEMGGLKDLLQSGDPVKFKIRSGWSANQASNRSSSKARRTSGTEWPWMEVDGPPRQGRLRLQLRASRSQAPKGSDYWSSPLSVDSFGGAAVVQAPCPINAAAGRQSFPNAAYYFAVTSHLISRTGGAWSLHIMPRYILVNRTSAPLQYRQQGVPIEHNLRVHACTCIQWPDARRPLRLNIRIKESGWLWSGGISLESPGDMFVKVRHRHREETMLLQVDVSMSRSGVLMARLSHQLDGFAPYRLDNCTNEKLHVRQEGCREQEDVLRPYSSIPYAWDEPAGIHKVVLELPGHRLIGTLKLDQVGSTARVALQPDPSSPYTNRKRRLHILVVAEGPTRVMVVMDEDVHPSMVQGAFNRSLSHEQLGWHSWSSPPGGASSKKSRTADVRTGFEVEMHLSGVGISFVTAYKELLYAWICEPQLCLAVGKVRYRLECAVNRFQLDNCIRDAVYPVLFRGPASGHGRRQSAITVRASIWRRRPGGVVCVELLHLDFAPLALEIEEAHMGEICIFFDAHIKSLVNPIESSREQHQPDVVILEDGRAWSQIVPKAKIYIESLIVSRTDLTFSFCPASWRLSGSENLQRRMGPSNPLLQRILAFADVEAAHIHIKGLELQHPLLSQNALFALIGRHYMRGLVHEVYKIVGSADILGDPVRLVHHLGLGVWSLFSNPASAALEETSSKLEIPQRVLFGFAMGLRSLLSNTIYAFSNATAKLSLAARKGLVLLRLEDESQLRNARRGMTRNARLSLTKSMDSGLVEAIMDALGGLLSEPVRGVEEAGLVGLVRGTMRGMVGLLVRPTARALEISSRMADSIQALVSGYRGPMPLMRVPRMVDPSAPLQMYDGLDAVGALVLAEANDGVFTSDILLSCVEGPSKGRFIVVTHRHLLIVLMRNPNSPYSFPKVILGISLDEVESITIKQGAVCLLGIPLCIHRKSQSPFAWWEVECGPSLAPVVASHVLYASKNCPRRIQRVGHALCLQSRLFIR